MLRNLRCVHKRHSLVYNIYDALSLVSGKLLNITYFFFKLLVLFGTHRYRHLCLYICSLEDSSIAGTISSVITYFSGFLSLTELTFDLSAFTTHVLRLQVCATTAGLLSFWFLVPVGIWVYKAEGTGYGKLGDTSQPSHNELKANLGYVRPSLKKPKH